MLSLQAEALSKSFNVSQSAATSPNGGGAPLSALHGLQPWAPPNGSTAGC
jgi:hypothetical protein